MTDFDRLSAELALVLGRLKKDLSDDGLAVLPIIVEAGGKGVFDTTLTVKGATGLMVSHTHRVISHSALKFTADAVLFAVRSNGLTFHT